MRRPISIGALSLALVSCYETHGTFDETGVTSSTTSINWPGTVALIVVIGLVVLFRKLVGR